MLLDRGKPLTLEQLELVVSYAPQLAGRAAPVLYREAKRLGADHVIEALRSLWLRYGRPTPIKCPRCGFNSVTPDLSCIICGASLEEEEVKETIGFSSMLRAFARSAPALLILEALRAGYVVVNHEVKPPSLKRPGSFGVDIYLTREERRILEEELRRRGQEH